MAPPKVAGATAVTSPPQATLPTDPMPFLLEDPPRDRRASVLPRAAFVELGGPQASPDSEPRASVDVLLVETSRTLARVAVRGPLVRYVVWVRRDDLQGVLARDVTIGAAMPGKPSVTLRRGARVDILERTAEQVRIRYSGSVEVEASIAADAVAELGDLIDGGGPVLSGGKLFHASPGVAIRVEPRWTAPALAVLARTYFVEEVQRIDDAWSEVQYLDGAVSVRGFASRRDPPVRVHGRTGLDASTPLPTPDRLPANVCLYAAPQGEVVGLTVSQTPVALGEDEREQWRSVTLDTPWSAMRFFARRDKGQWQPCEREP